LPAETKRIFMGKLMFFLYFILSVFPADATENRRHIHVVRRGSKKSHRGDTVAKIWIEENGLKKIDIAWSELNADEESEIIKVIDENWDELNKLINKVFAGKKIQIKRIK
jgi:LPS sulfotransferase NodH